MGTIASLITSLTIVYSTVYSDADQRKYQSSASLAFVREIHRRPVNSPHKWPVTRKMFPFDDIIMICAIISNIRMAAISIHLSRLTYNLLNKIPLNKLYMIPHEAILLSMRIFVSEKSFSCDKAALRILLSIRLPVLPSVGYTFFIMFLSLYHQFSWVITNDRSDVYAKGQGQRSKVKLTEVKIPFSCFRTVTPV